jgi:hypothetical protein
MSLGNRRFQRAAGSSFAIALLVGTWLGGCEAEEEPRSTDQAGGRAGIAPRPTAEAVRPASVRAREHERCDNAIAAAMKQPSLPGTPELDARRARLLARVNGEPLLLTRPPAPGPTDDPGILW